MNVSITGVPDGVSPRAAEALIDGNAPRRLYIYSNQPMTEDYLQTIDSFYGKRPYPIKRLNNNNACGYSPVVPKFTNFYTTRDSSEPTNVSQYVEYRHLQLRHIKTTNILYELNTGEYYRFTMPKHTTPLVLLMPENFIATGSKCGYFEFENNIIVRVYSRYYLYANNRAVDHNMYSLFCTNDTRFMSILSAFMIKLGLHRVYKPTSTQVIAYDRYITAVVGDVANLNLP
uniref:GrBNV_gp35-like protein n=1 Tax=Nilaparvata lugens endogenous nudivirus TaxID=1487700 RepID=X5GE67_9VIRU|nr:GrBNV_gp35-like protein [Nilaparvata lugens endogenous nudivirus]